MMFHREARLPIEADVEQNETVTSEDIDTETTADAFIEKMLKRQEDIKSIAGENIKKSQKKQKECYDKRHSPEELQPGIKVLVENTQQKERKGGKLENKYSGPYIIKTSDGKGVYTLKDLDGKVLKKKCNIKRLKAYMDPSSLVEQKALSGQTPPDKSNGSTPPEKSNGPTPPEKSNGPTSPEDPNGPTPPKKSNGPTPPEDPNGPTPPEKSNGPTPPEDPNGPTPPEKSDGPTPPEYMDMDLW
ncbi:circumsporozoite protein-like [Halichondria panicea]|uniref:circumsporozoite protein-like n=1 Tax=Halichondria panicea TaxID=6063 RepID=UPI00312B34A8